MKASLPKLLNSFVRHTAVGFTPRRPVSKIGDQGVSARDEIFVSRGFDESARNAHGFSPVLPSKGFSTRRRLLRCRISPRLCRRGVTSGPPPWPSYVRIRRVQTWSVRQAAQFCLVRFPPLPAAAP